MTIFQLPVTTIFWETSSTGLLAMQLFPTSLISDYHLLGDLLQRIAGSAAVVLLALTSDYHHLGDLLLQRVAGPAAVVILALSVTTSFWETSSRGLLALQL
jgi:hypothetical protein